MRAGGAWRTGGQANESQWGCEGRLAHLAGKLVLSEASCNAVLCLVVEAETAVCAVLSGCRGDAVCLCCSGCAPVQQLRKHGQITAGSARTLLAMHIHCCMCTYTLSLLSMTSMHFGASALDELPCLSASGGSS